MTKYIGIYFLHRRRNRSGKRDKPSRAGDAGGVASLIDHVPQKRTSSELKVAIVHSLAGKHLATVQLPTEDYSCPPLSEGRHPSI